MDFPPTIHDFGGFPKALSDVQYPAPGSLKVANETISLLHSVHAEPDNDWGLDHGAWTVVRHMYPEANVPVLQLSIDYSKGPQYHYDLINFNRISPDISLAIPTSEHYLPLIYSLGLQSAKDEVSFFNDKAVGGSLTMTSVRFG